MKKFLLLLSIYSIFLKCDCYDFFPVNREYQYDIESSVEIGALSGYTKSENTKTNNWSIYGKILVQRKDRSTLAVVFKPLNVNISNSTRLYDIKDTTVIQTPFKINLNDKGAVLSVTFKNGEPIWAANIKRSIAYGLQIQDDGDNDAYVVEENGLHGNCITDYFIVKDNDTPPSVKLSKSPMLDTCTPFSGGIHSDRNYHLTNHCNKHRQKNVLVSNEADYKLYYNLDYLQLHIEEAIVRSNTTVHTFELNGESQYISSKLHLSNGILFTVDDEIDIYSDMSHQTSTLQYVNPDTENIKESAHMFEEITKVLLNKIVNELEDKNPNYDLPYDSNVANLFRTFEFMQTDSFRVLYDHITDLTISENRKRAYKKFYLEALKRTGTKDSIDYVMELLADSELPSIDRFKLITAIPFHIADPNENIVKICEKTLLTDHESRKFEHSLWDASMLSFSTIVFKAFSAGKISSALYEEYVKKFYNFLRDSTEYSEQVTYIQALGNLQLGSVPDYLDTIITNTSNSEDLRYLAMWAAMPMSGTRPEKTYEIFWPIFAINTNPLQLRIVAFSILLTSNPTPGRLMSLHRIIKDEKSQHLINFYRTTILSISESTYPCFQNLRRLLSYMVRHLPDEPHKRYWVTGNYIVDYKNNEFGTSGLIQGMLVGNEQNDSPMSGYLKLSTEAHGKFTEQFGIYVKVRGFVDLIYNIDRNNLNNQHLNINHLITILKSMNYELQPKTKFHFEGVLQTEGKTISSVVLTELDLETLAVAALWESVAETATTDIYNRELTINMPFYANYKVPTAIGTSAEVIIQNTVLTAISLNITKGLHFGDNFEKLFTSDYKHTEYLKCGIESHNPYLGLAHTIEREQGSLIYIPFNFTLIHSELEKSIGLKFIQSNKVIGGFSVNSRTGTLTHGVIDGEIYTDVVYNYGYKNNVDVDKIDYFMEDIGINVKIQTIKEQFNNFIKPFTDDSNIEINTNVLPDDEEIDYLLKLVNAYQLSAIHIGTDKKFQVLIETKKSEIDIIFSSETEVLDHVGFGVVMKYDDMNETMRIVEKCKVGVDVDLRADTYGLKTYYHNINGDSDFRVCTSFKYNPLVFLSTPEYIEIESYFGYNSGETGCPIDLTFLRIQALQDISPSIKAESLVLRRNEDALCPLDMLKINPPPYDNICKREVFKRYATLSYYFLNVYYENVPLWITEILNDISTTMFAFGPDELGLLNLTNGFNVSLHDSSHLIGESMKLHLNGNEIEIPQALDWFDIMPDINYDSDEKLDIEYGFISSCSIINDRINTFNDEHLSLNDYFPIRNKLNSCSTLILGDCSENPKFALFLDKIVIRNEIKYDLKVYTGGNFVTLTQNPFNPDSTIVQNKNNCFSLDSGTYNDDHGDLVISKNRNGIIEIKNKIVHLKVQYNGKKVLSIQVPTAIRNKFCGLCNYPINFKENISTFTYCGDRQTTICNRTY